MDHAPASSPAGGPPRESLTVRLLKRLTDLIYRYPRAFFYPQALLFLVSLLGTVWFLEFDTNRAKLVGEEKRYHQNFLRYKKEFNVQDEIVAVVESENVEKNRQFVERLGRRLEQETNLFHDVLYKSDLKMMGRKALLFVTNETILAEMSQRLQEARPVLTNFSQVTNLNSLFRTVITQFKTAPREKSDQNNALLKSLPALGRIADQAADALSRPGIPPSPGITALFGGGESAEENLYITSASNHLYLATARPTSTSLSKPAVARMRELVRETQAEVPGVNVGVTGEPVLEVDEMAQSQTDTTIATILSLGICALLFIYGYQETGRPVKATICLVVGLVYTFGFATLTIGHLNVLTITFLPMLIGMAIDFGIHLVSRYEEELRLGQSERQALELAIVNTGQGIFTGCFTTSAAFLAMGFTDFKGIREMGIISGGGLLICLVPMITLLPVLLLRGRQNALDHQPDHPPADPRAKLERVWLNRPWTTLGVALTASILAACYLPRIYFDYNLLHMQSRGLPAVLYELKLIDSAKRSVIFGVVTVESLEEARKLKHRIEQLPTVASVDSMVSYLADDPTPKLGRIREIKSHLAQIRFAEIDTDPVDLKQLRLTLRTLGAYFGLGATMTERSGETEISEELRQTRQALLRLYQAIGATDPAQAEKKLALFQTALLQDLQGTLTAIRDQDDTGPLTADDLPAALRHRFVSKSGTKYLLQVNPRFDVWQRTNQLAFVSDLRRLDPDVTGPPVQLLEYTTLLKDSYEEAAYYALGAVVLLVLIQFRSVTCVFLALLPVGLGTLWLVGWMGWAGIPFNPANIMTLPLVVGVGVTNGIHVLNRFAEEHDPGIFARSTGKAVLLSALTTIAGFGSLVFAKHQGIASLGIIMAVGTGTCMLAGVTVLPCLLKLLSRGGWQMPGRQNATYVGHDAAATAALPDKD